MSRWLAGHNEVGRLCWQEGYSPQKSDASGNRALDSVAGRLQEAGCRLTLACWWHFHAPPTSSPDVIVHATYNKTIGQSNFQELVSGNTVTMAARTPADF